MKTTWFGRSFFILCACIAASFLFAKEAKAATCCPQFPMQPSTVQLVLAPSTYTDSIVLVANTAQSIGIPAGAQYAIFSGECNFYVNPAAAATVPVATTTNGSSAILSPTAWNVRTIRTYSIISAVACKVTVSYYS